MTIPPVLIFNSKISVAETSAMEPVLTYIFDSSDWRVSAFISPPVVVLPIWLSVLPVRYTIDPVLILVEISFTSRI